MSTLTMSRFQSAAVQTAREGARTPRVSAALPRRILIVEDESVLAKNMKTYLSRGASDVRTAADAAHAFELLESFSPDALVMDFGLPGVDGLRTYAEIVRRQERKIECVMITGNPTDQIAQDARELGILHVVCKPFPFSELERLLENPEAENARDVPDAGAWVKRGLQDEGTWSLVPS